MYAQRSVVSIILTILVVCRVVAEPQVLRAQSIDSVFRTRLSNGQALLQKAQERPIVRSAILEHRNGSSKQIKEIAPIRIGLGIRTLGRLQIVFDREWVVNWPALTTGMNGVASLDNRRTKLLRGFYSIRSGRSRNIRNKKFPIAASIREVATDSFVAEFIFQGENGRRRHKPTTYLIQVPLFQSEGSQMLAAVKRAPLVNLHMGECATGSGTDHMTIDGLQVQTSATTEAAQAYKILDIAIDIDYDFATKNPDPHGRVAAIMNGVDALYEPLGIGFNVTKQHLWAAPNEPFSSSDPKELLQEFGTYVKYSDFRENADLAHLFTGKDLTSSVIGIAWIGVLCDPYKTSYAVGITQHVNGVQEHLVAAHEIGHNHGAQHDKVTKGSLMYPSLKPESGGFSQSSLDQITGYLQSVPSCFDTGERTDNDRPGPYATPYPDEAQSSVSLTVQPGRRKKGVQLLAVATSSNGQPLPHTMLNLWYLNEDASILRLVGVDMTDGAGKVTFHPLNSGVYFSSISEPYAESEKIQVRVTKKVKKKRKGRKRGKR